MGCSVLGRSAIALAAAMISCASPPPSAVDLEAPLIDLAACARGEPSCERSGQVGPHSFLVNDNEAVVMVATVECGEARCPHESQECCADSLQCSAIGTCTGPTADETVPARISLPLHRPSDDARLAWVAIGVFAGGKKGRTMTLTVTGSDPVELSVGEWMLRTEVSMGSVVPPPDARVEIAVTKGTIGLMYVVGRWKR
jgi:hypothetical protein